jgi:hypothetical protein
MQASELNARAAVQIEALLPGIHAGFDAPCAAVRLRSLEALVAAFAVLGSRIEAFMLGLPKTQQRLVHLYLKRVQPADLAASARAVRASAPQ